MSLSAIIRLILPLALVFAYGVSAAWAGAAAGPAWVDFESGIGQAKKDGKFILVDFSTGWCRDCKNMDRTTFSDPGVIKRLGSEFVAVKVDAEKRSDLATKYQVVAYPTFVVLDRSGAKASQRIGYMSKEELYLFLDYVKSGAYKSTSYQDYIKNRK